jgi:RNA polymerase sigma factor for flagellar operon FliA
MYALATDRTESPRRYTIDGAELSREQIVHKCLHLVKYIAGRLAVSLPSSVELDDLVGEGMYGLLEAIEKYDASRGVKFETYAIIRIHGAMLDALRALDWVPRAIRRKTRELEQVREALERDFERVPTQAEIARRLGVSVDELHRLLSNNRRSTVVSLEEQISARSDGATLFETIEDESTDVAGDAERAEIRRELLHAIASLPMQQREVVFRRYYCGQSIKEIRLAMGLCESRVSQIHAQGVAGLREHLRGRQADYGFYADGHRETRKYVRKPAKSVKAAIRGIVPASRIATVPAR